MQSQRAAGSLFNTLKKKLNKVNAVTLEEKKKYKNIYYQKQIKNKVPGVHMYIRYNRKMNLLLVFSRIELSIL